MKELVIDLLVFWSAVAVGLFGWRIHAPVLVLMGVIFFIASVIWMAMDLYALLGDECE